MKKDLVFGGVLLLLAVFVGVLYWVGGHDQFMLAMRLNNYEIKAASIFILGYVAVRLLSLWTSHPLSYLAVFSTLNVILNPLVIHFAMMRFRPSDVVGLGDSELRSFAAGLVSFVCGIIALVRILRSHGSLRGLPFAAFGVVGGGIWVGYWLIFAYRIRHVIGW